jgi:hypothetical protein
VLFVVSVMSFHSRNVFSSADKNLKLDHELFMEVKPGLSAFSDSPKKVLCTPFDVEQSRIVLNHRTDIHLV